MLERESWNDGWQVRVSVAGRLQAVRVVPAAFLSMWLGGWVVGERFAGELLLAGLRDRFAPGQFLQSLPQPHSSMPVPALAFLGVWLAFWTMGGVFAISTLVAVLFGSPVARWNDHELELAIDVGPFSRSRRVELAKLGEMKPGPLNTLVDATGRTGMVIGPFADASEVAQMREWLLEAQHAGVAEPEPIRAVA
jgi:hypothetical protein